MKFFVTALFICSFALISGCSKDDPAGPEDNEQMIISGKIEGWNLGTDKYILLYNIDNPSGQLGNGPIASDGSFSFKAERPTSLKAINLEYYASSECSDTLIATQKNVNIYTAELIVVKMEEHKKFGYVSHEFRGDTIYNSALIYVDKAVRLTGSFECPPQYNHREYDLNFVYGWNMRYACFTPDGKYYKETTTNPGKANLHIVNN